MGGRSHTQHGRSYYDRLGVYHGIEEYRLRKNGLRVLYHYDSSSPVIGCMVTYLVGSRHEAVGYTGATHLLEHLMFKGSKHFPKKNGVSALDRLGEKGALVNATTWLDRTNYYEVVPEEHFEYVLTLEADRMRNAVITKRDLDEEMPAVRSEYALRIENDELEYLDEHVWATAFLAHPYHHPTIGWLPDIENVPLTKLQSFYDTYYWPNNAVLSVVGSIPRERALSLIAKHFGVHRSSPSALPNLYTMESPQQGRRFVEIVRPGAKHMVAVAFKVPHALHVDTPALTVLASILADGVTSRLYRSLVEKKLCLEVHTQYMPLKDPGLFTIYAVLSEGVTHEKVERVIRDVCAGVISEVSDRELERVRAGLATSIAFARDGHFALLSALNEAIAVGDWRFFFDMPEKVARVDAEAVRDVARRYCTDLTMTVGYYRHT